MRAGHARSWSRHERAPGRSARGWRRSGPRGGVGLNWHSVGEFLHMGGYGLYVWGSFAMCALVIGLECRGVAARRRALRDLPLDERDDIDERPLHEA